MADDFDLTAQGALDEEPEPEDIEESGDGGEEATEEPAAPATPAAPAEQTAATGEEPLVRAGETPEQALARLEAERRGAIGRSTAHYHELKEVKAELEQIRRENAAAARLYQALTARIAPPEEEEPPPDPDRDPERALLYEQKKLREQLDAWRAEQKAEKEAAQQTAEQRRLEQIDNQQALDVLAGLGQIQGAEPDPQFVEDFNLVEGMQWRQIEARYPEATQEQKLEAMGWLRKLEGRRAAFAGSSLRAAYAEQANLIRSAVGGAAPAQPATNGKAKRPTPAEIAAQAAAGTGGVRRIGPAGGAGVKPPKTLADFAALSEEDQQKLIDAGKFSEEELFGALGEDGWAPA